MRENVTDLFLIFVGKFLVSFFLPVSVMLAIDFFVDIFQQVEEVA